MIDIKNDHLLGIQIHFENCESFFIPVEDLTEFSFIEMPKRFFLQKNFKNKKHYINKLQSIDNVKISFDAKKFLEFQSWKKSNLYCISSTCFSEEHTPIQRILKYPDITQISLAFEDTIDNHKYFVNLFVAFDSEDQQNNNLQRTYIEACIDNEEIEENIQIQDLYHFEDYEKFNEFLLSNSKYLENTTIIMNIDISIDNYGC